MIVFLIVLLMVVQNFKVDLDTTASPVKYLLVVTEKRKFIFQVNCPIITLASPSYFQGAAAILGERESESTGQATKKVQFCPSIYLNIRRHH